MILSGCELLRLPSKISACKSAFKSLSGRVALPLEQLSWMECKQCKLQRRRLPGPAWHSAIVGVCLFPGSVIFAGDFGRGLFRMPTCSWDIRYISMIYCSIAFSSDSRGSASQVASFKPRFRKPAFLFSSSSRGRRCGMGSLQAPFAPRTAEEFRIGLWLPTDPG